MPLWVTWPALEDAEGLEAATGETRREMGNGGDHRGGSPNPKLAMVVTRTKAVGVCLWGNPLGKTVSTDGSFPRGTNWGAKQR